jgi:hypothetical protein
MHQKPTEHNKRNINVTIENLKGKQKKIKIKFGRFTSDSRASNGNKTRKRLDICNFTFK